jgi:hypothetical protein
VLYLCHSLDPIAIETASPSRSSALLDGTRDPTNREPDLNDLLSSSGSVSPPCAHLRGRVLVRATDRLAG